MHDLTVLLLLALSFLSLIHAAEIAVSALSVNDALANHIPLVFSATTARAFVESRATASSSTSAIVDHLPALRQLAALGNSVVEFGTRDIAVTYALLAGVSESAPRSGRPRRFTSGAGAAQLPIELTLPLGRALEVNISLRYGMDALIDGADVLVIDGLQNYGALSRALTMAASRVRGFIAIPRSEAFGLVSETVRLGLDVSAAAAAEGWLPIHEAAGTKAAIFDFLASPTGIREWSLSAHFSNGGGLTVLRRIAAAATPPPPPP